MIRNGLELCSCYSAIEMKFEFPFLFFTYTVRRLNKRKTPMQIRRYIASAELLPEWSVLRKLAASLISLFGSKSVFD